MPRFFFHLETDAMQVKDEHGLSLPDAEAAWYQAVRCARDLIHAERAIGCGWSGQCVRIEDESGTALGRVPLQEVALYPGVI